MEVELLDLRRVSPRYWRSRVSTSLAARGRDFGLLIGHGDDRGVRFCGMRANDIASTGSYLHIMIHACNSARGFAPRLAEAGVATYGFVSNVLATTESGVEFSACIQAVRALPHDATIEEVRAKIQDAWGDLAQRFLRNGRDLATAAVLSHLRLALRAFKPP